MQNCRISHSYFISFYLITQLWWVIMILRCLSQCPSIYLSDVNQYLPYVFGQTGLSNSLHPDETLQNAVSHQDLHCLPLLLQFLDTNSRTSMVRSWGVWILSVHMVSHLYFLLICQKIARWITSSADTNKTTPIGAVWPRFALRAWVYRGSFL